MNKQIIKSIYLFTLLAPMYATLNILIFTVMSMHIHKNGGEWGDYFLMYFSLSAVVISMPLGFINYKLRKKIGGVWEVISLISLIILVILGLVFFASIVYSYQ